MTNKTERRLQRVEAQVAGIEPGCPVCRPPGNIQTTDDHGFAGLPVDCARCGRPRPADQFVVRFVARDNGPQ